MKITINGSEATQAVLADSLVLDRYGANRSTLTFSMESFVGTIYTAPSIAAGMEVKLYGDDGSLMWAGILESCVMIQRNVRLRGMNVVCRGYEHVLSRLAIEPLYVKAASVGLAAKVLFTRHLAAEGLKAADGNFDMTGMITEYSSGKWKRLSRIYDELSAMYGHRWWIDKNKNFYFKASAPIRETDDRLLLHTVSPVKYLDFTLRKSIGAYRNCQVASNRGTVFGTAEDSAEIARMKAYFGTGKYYGIMESDGIESASQAQGMAQSLLRGAGGMPETIAFTSDIYCPELFDVLRVQGPQYGYAELTKFVILQVRSRLENGKFLHKITAGKMYNDQVRAARSWEEILSGTL